MKSHLSFALAVLLLVSLCVAGVPSTASGLPPDSHWKKASTSISHPSAREHHTAIHDPLRNEMVVFGGFDFQYLNDVWTFSLQGQSGWTQLSPSGTLPSRRHEHMAIYDPVRDRMVFFGGIFGSTHFNDSWALSLGENPTWSELTPLGDLPATRHSHTAIYDLLRDRMIIFGGVNNNTGEMFNDVWVLLFSPTPTWVKLEPAGTAPTGRFAHMAIHDPDMDRMLIVGGYDGTAFVNDVWALSLAGETEWTKLSPSGNPPIGRVSGITVHDPVRNRMIMVGGWSGSVFLDDTWAFSLSDPPVWSEIRTRGLSPAPRRDHAGIYSRENDRVILFGGVGVNSSTLFDDTWELRFRRPRLRPTDDIQPSPNDLAFALLGSLANPSSRDLVVGFTLPGSAPATLELFDARGRRVATREVGSLGAGDHSLQMAVGDRVSVGIYFLRLTQDAETRLAKVVIIP